MERTSLSLNRAKSLITEMSTFLARYVGGCLLGFVWVHSVFKTVAHAYISSLVVIQCQDAKKVRGTTLSPNANYGYDDEKGDYRVVSGDHVAYRYEVLSVLGMWP